MVSSHNPHQTGQDCPHKHTFLEQVPLEQVVHLSLIDVYLSIALRGNQEYQQESHHQQDQVKMFLDRDQFLDEAAV